MQVSKKILFLFALVAIVATAHAQQDPVLLTIDGNPVTRSEFMYSYQKNNNDGVVDKKNIEEYLQLFINYKLKVQAALDAGLDTLASFKKEYASYRDPQLIPSVVTDNDVEVEAQRIYQEAKDRAVASGGLLRAAHIILGVGQQADKQKMAEAKVRIDSIYNRLKAGDDFAELARKYSVDPGTAEKGGELPWLESTQVFKEFADVVWKMNAGELSQPFETPAGYHIVKVLERCDYVPYDTVRSNIIQYIDRVGIKQKLFDKKMEDEAVAANASVEELIGEKVETLTANDSDLKNLLREYHDGLLLFEISNKTIWENTANDEAALQQHFKANKKKFAWDEPRFKGMAYHVKDAKDVKAVKKAVKGLAFDKWNEKLRSTFNNDSVLRIRVEKGYFKKGDSPLIDREVFKVPATVKVNPEFPIDAVYGKLLKVPAELNDVRQRVVSDLQEKREKEWIEQLRKTHKVEVNYDVLNTIK